MCLYSDFPLRTIIWHLSPFAGIHPDGATYTPILIALGKSLPVDLEKVLHTADAMLQAGIALNHYSLPAILRCCARAKASDVAVAVFESNCHTVYVWNDHVQRALKEAVGTDTHTQFCCLQVPPTPVFSI